MLPDTHIDCMEVQMRRSVVIGILSAAALALPALAPAQVARATHSGKLLGVSGSQVKFKEILDPDNRSVTSFAVRDFEVACSDGVTGTLRVAKLKGRIDASDGAFKARNDNGRTVFEVSGVINRNKALGRFRYSGQIEDENGVSYQCDSGRLDWVTRP